MAESKKVTVALMNPVMCLSCNFYFPTTIMIEGVSTPITGCRRKDCDNWIYPSLKDLPSADPPKEA